MCVCARACARNELGLKVCSDSELTYDMFSHTGGLVASLCRLSADVEKTRQHGHNLRAFCILNRLHLI